MIGRRVEDFPAPIGTLAELRVQTQRAWDEIPQAEIDHLILSMPQRLNECIRLRGDTTHFYFFNIFPHSHNLQIFLKLLSFIVLPNFKLSSKFQVCTIIHSGCSAFFGDQCRKIEVM
jgi:hypothetical protein